MKKIFFAILMMAIMFGFKDITEEIEGVVATYQPDQGKYTYNIPLQEVPEWPDPVVSGEWMDWGMESINNASNGFYHFEVTAFNGPINFYWNNRKPRENPYLNVNTPGYNAENGCMRYYLKDGHVYTTPQEQKLPGTNGDHLIRWTINNDGTVTVFCNNGDIESGSINPFVIHSASTPTKWWENKINQTVLDASGWGSTVGTIKNNTYQDENNSKTSFLLVGFGAYKNGEVKYPRTILTSQYLNNDTTGFKIQLQ